GLPAVPTGRDETLPERPAVFYGKVRDREAELHPRPARAVAPREDGGVRRPTAREAEGEADVRALGAAVPELFREGGEGQGADGREPDGDAGTAPGQRDLPDGVRELESAGTSVRAARAHTGEGTQSERVELPGTGGRRHRAEGQDAPERDGAGGAEPGAAPGRGDVAGDSPGTVQGPGAGAAEAGGRADAADERAVDRRAV